MYLMKILNFKFLTILTIIHCNLCFGVYDIKDVHIVYFKGKTLNDIVKYSIYNFQRLLNLKEFKSRNSTVIYIHGYEETLKSITLKNIVQAYLSTRFDTNVIVVDWSNLSDKGYLNNAASNTEMIGRAVGTYLLTLIGKGIRKSSIHIIGFSLGCHVAASIGRTMQVHGVTLPRITGLDCAFPGFFPAFIGRRLSSSLADFVDSIHTDSGMYGQPISFGHADYWPNGGKRKQPGCENVDIFRNVGINTLNRELCSHVRSCDYYAESVKNPKHFIALKCVNYEYFKNNRCDEQGVMGYGANKMSRGNYYLITSNKSPFGKGAEGIKWIK